VFLFAHAYGTRDDELARIVGEWILWALDDKGVRQWGWTWPIHSFILEILRRWRHIAIQPPRVLPGLGAYEGIYGAWSDPPAFASALATACNYHCERACVEPDDESDQPSYYAYPEKVFPVEILALRRLRQDEGLSFPEVAHPLLDTVWWCSVPATPPDFSDPLLDEYRARFPNVLDAASNDSHE
jgi:hypothetical protein